MVQPHPLWAEGLREVAEASESEAKRGAKNTPFEKLRFFLGMKWMKLFEADEVVCSGMFFGFACVFLLFHKATSWNDSLPKATGGVFYPNAATRTQRRSGYLIGCFLVVVSIFQLAFGLVGFAFAARGIIQKVFPPRIRFLLHPAERLQAEVFPL